MKSGQIIENVTSWKTLQTQRRSFLFKEVTIEHSSRCFRASTINRSRGYLQVVIHHMGKNMNRVRPILGLRCARSCNLHRKAHRDKKFSYRILHLNQDLAINENRRKSAHRTERHRGLLGNFPKTLKITSSSKVSRMSASCEKRRARMASRSAVRPEEEGPAADPSTGMAIPGKP